MSFTYNFPMAGNTVDVVVHDHFDNILLVRRNSEVEHGKLAFPGGYMEIDEPLKVAAIRELREETGLVFPNNQFEFEMVADRPKRDTRGRVISTIYSLLVPDLYVLQKKFVRQEEEVLELVIRDYNGLNREEMAFDHYDIMLNVLFGLRYDSGDN